ncbi:LPXTG cell wall anchor domain-containing protein [Amycolatopsis suaedae]|uniref:LPXTG cell wall anchor domain-containing protein n=1 Tax=Amycolatopsis suaedae TaxID=2510978 RepID=A0A4Q7J692_9PSEU|nr:LPXTG cell wall anchor domain-containing protein [Amycolatopsis suaedae]RZQ62272.1 LPXTG cell wall anchor domain-containing protein [Amycolatopsis suaedae]
MYKPGTAGVTGGVGTLAVTGAGMSWWISLAVTLVIAGTLVVLFARRRRRLAREDGS